MSVLFQAWELVKDCVIEGRPLEDLPDEGNRIHRKRWDFAKKGGFRVEKMWWILEIFHEILDVYNLSSKDGVLGMTNSGTYLEI